MIHAGRIYERTAWSAISRPIDGAVWLFQLRRQELRDAGDGIRARLGI
jgi:hypothetical protein